MSQPSLPPLDVDYGRSLDAARAAWEFAAMETPAAASRSLPSHGEDWDAAIELGVDVTLILRNLSLPPHERLRQAAQHQHFIDSVQQRTVAAGLREQLERARLWEKIDTLGGPDPAWPEALHDRHDRHDRR